MSKKPANLREQFTEACSQEALWDDYEKGLEKGHNGTTRDFCARFDEIAAGLKAGLETLIDDVGKGRSVITSPYDAYKHLGEPLKFEIVIPAVCDKQQRERLEASFYYLPGYRKIHEICAGKDVDMNVVTAFRSASYRARNGEMKKYCSILIEITPGRPYAAERDYKPLPPTQVGKFDI